MWASWQSTLGNMLLSTSLHVRQSEHHVSSPSVKQHRGCLSRGLQQQRPHGQQPIPTKATSSSCAPPVSSCPVVTCPCCHHIMPPPPTCPGNMHERACCPLWQSSHTLLLKRSQDCSSAVVKVTALQDIHSSTPFVSHHHSQHTCSPMFVYYSNLCSRMMLA
jgi:hypothetical protein